MTPLRTSGALAALVFLLLPTASPRAQVAASPAVDASTLRTVRWRSIGPANNDSGQSQQTDTPALPLPLRDKQR